MATVASHPAVGDRPFTVLHEPGEPLLGSGPISPELVLVDPELRALALRALPDRPWETYLPVRVAPPATVAASAASAVAPPRDVSQRPLPTLADPPLRAPAAPPVEKAERPTWLRRAGTLAVLAAAVVGIANLGNWESGGERLIPSVEAAPRPPVLPSAAPPAYRSGSYIIGKRGWLRTGKRGRAIVELHLPVFCKGAQIEVGRVPIGKDGRFRFAGVARTGPRFRVTLAGRFQTNERARGSVVVRGPGCPSRKAPFVASLS